MKEVIDGLIIIAVLLAVILLSSCEILDECQPGESQACNCGQNSYVTYCTMDGYFQECNCYINRGNNYEVTVDTMSGTMTGGNQEAINDLYDELPQSICNEDEIAIPGKRTCIRICPVGMTMVDGQCTGYPIYQTYNVILNECRKYNADYRIISMDEMSHLLSECYTNTFSVYEHNFCSPYLVSPIRYAMQLPNVSTFSTWIDQMIICDDAYGQIEKNCAWDAKFYLTTRIDTELNLFRASAQYGSAMSSGICVRN